MSKTEQLPFRAARFCAFAAAFDFAQADGQFNFVRRAGGGNRGGGLYRIGLYCVGLYCVGSYWKR